MNKNRLAQSNERTKEAKIGKQPHQIFGFICCFRLI
jgi:hypothetical protein